MKKSNLLLGILAIMLVFAITVTGCDNGTKDDNGGGTGGSGGGNGGTGGTGGTGGGQEKNTFTTITDLYTWLAAQPGNTATKPYTVKLNVSNLGGDSSKDGSAGKALMDNPFKYISIELSGFSIIGREAFYSCNYLTSVTIGNSVTVIEPLAFYDCYYLTSVTFQGTIADDSFGGISFPGDLQAKYLAGGIGTYTREAGSYTWTKN